MISRSRFLRSRSALFLLLALVSAAFAAGAAPRDNGDGTVTDSATGLTWIADPEFAAAVGLGSWAPRADAIALVRAMNAGEVENFGRTDWRLPTAREAATLAPAPTPGDGPRRLAAPAFTGPGLVSLRPVSGSALVAGLSEAVVVAIESLRLDRGAVVVGDVVVNEGGGAGSGWEVQVDRDARIEGNVSGDRVRLDRGVTVVGTVSANQLSAGKASVGATVSPLALPVLSMLPPLAASLPRAGAAAVSVGSGEVRELPAGDYLEVSVAAEGTLVLEGGAYEVADVSLGDGARLLFRAASELRVRGRLSAGSGVEIGPEAGSGLDGADALFAIGGIDGADGVFGSQPRAVEVGSGATIRANLQAPDGSVRLGQQAVLEGAIVAGQVQIDRLARLTLASAWGNQPPTATPQTATTSGASSIVLTLTGSDPEGGDLAFAIVGAPGAGTLSTPVPIVPAPVPGRDGGPTVQPAITSASVTYTPAGSGDVADSFTFQVSDPFGSFGTAVVTLNPPGANEQPPPPPPGTVVASDLTATVRNDSSGILGFTAAGPDGVGLSYALVAGSGPSHGVLGPIAAGPGAPPVTATASYTPDSGFVGTDGFSFEVCGTIGGAPVCQQASYTVEVVTPPVEPRGELAEDRSVTAVQDVPILIDLLSGASESETEAGSIAGAVRRVTGDAVGISVAAVAGNVADANGDGFGDEANALPGPAPGLVSAGVGLSGGAGSNGTVRIHLEFGIAGFGDGSGLVSAQVQLPTHRGSIDSLDTEFWWVGDEGNGTLEASDFERPAETLAVIMPVPASQAVGEAGSFSFSVLPQLQEALAAGHDILTIQGRVDESLAGPARGLEVRSTADGNLSTFNAPTLSFATPPPLPPQFLVTITALPQHGTLSTPSGTEITSVPFSMSTTDVRYEPDPGFVGTDSFTYEVTDFVGVDSGTVTVVVEQGSCDESASDCDDGR